MKKDNTKFYIWAFIVLALVAGLYFYVKMSSSGPTSYDSAKLDAFAQCLASKNITMYGAYWCQYCQKEKAAFGGSFKYIPYVECTEETRKCLDQKIQGYPTWIFPDGQRLVGFQELEKLATASGCSLP